MDAILAGPPAGQLLDGRYRVASSIAHGGMATVYLGLDTRLDRTVAIKIMHAELAADQDFVARFIREARSVAQLSHPNVVAVYDQGSDGRHLYLAMEYVPGRTLRQLLSERGQLSSGEALDIIESVLAGLAAAHQAGIVHRDVKPENVLLAEDGRVKVADFGLARSISGTSHTKTGVLMGTVAYLAPEQVTASVSDARCDVYAAGVMLFELLTGTQPHTGESALAVAYKHVNETVPPPSAVRPGLQQSLDALVALATSRDPGLRPADAGLFLQAVRGVRRGVPVPWPARRPPNPGMPPRGPLPPQPGRPQYGPGPRHAATLPAGARPPAPWEPAPAGFLPPAHHTLIVSRDGDGRDGAGPPREPRLQRWLFSRRLVYLVAVIVVLGLIGGIAWWQLAGRYTKVPPVTRLTVAAARAQLQGMGFTVKTGAARLDNGLAKGEVMATRPAAGAQVRGGATIELIPSAGPRMIGIPQVSGQTLANAETALRQAGLTPGRVVSQVSGTIPAGVVISTSPGAAVPQPQPSPVTLMVSAGPPLPDFSGQQKTAAEQWAAANGVSLNEQPAAKSSQPQNTITRQSPAANTPVSKGEVVTIYISPGPPNVQIPNVDSESARKAARQLQALGFQVTLQQVGPFGSQVFNYSPSGQAPKGSTITLYYGLPSLGGNGG
jgi:serine/threonine-protein kinase